MYGPRDLAPKFLLVDTDKDSYSVIDNGNAHNQHRSCNPATAIANQDIDAVVFGGIGGGALNKLNNLGLRVYQAEPSNIMSNIENLKPGSLKEISVSSCHSHGHDHSHGDGHSKLERGMRNRSSFNKN